MTWAALRKVRHPRNARHSPAGQEASTNTPQTVFAIVYAIMWGAQSGAFGRWKMFDTGRFCDSGADGSRTRWRFGWSILLLGLIPALYLAAAVMVLTNASWDLTHVRWSGSLFEASFLAALSAYFAIPGLYRIWLSLVQFRPRWFYPIDLGEYQWRRRFPSLLRAEFGPGQAKGNVTFGILYIAVSVIAGVILFRMVHP